MTRKRPHPSRTAEIPEADDLKLINGIGPAVENRLHRVGIFTFVQLASLAPADIAAAVADLAGLSSERILKQNWIGQARKLEAESTLAEPEWVDQAHKLALRSTSAETQKEMDTTTGAKLQRSAIEQHPGEQLVAHEFTRSPQEAEVSMKHLHEATFTVELLLDEENELNNMHIVHMQSGEEESWSGWQESQLAGFLACHANLRLQPVEDAAPEAEGIASSASVVGIESPVPASIMDSSVALLQVSKPQIVLSDTCVPQNVLRSDQPYDVHFTLHLTDTVTSPTSTLNYTASVYGRAVDQWTRRTIGVVRGAIKPKEEISVTIRGASLPQGIYWLEAEALAPLPPTPEETSPGRELLAMVKGRLFEIY